MRLLSTNDGEPAVIAVAQEAVGILALGQSATGVVAIGQIARGVFVAGQVAIGIVGVGQLVGCVAWGCGMLGIGGRGMGPVLRVLPRYRADGGRPVVDAPSTTMAQLACARAGTQGTLVGALRGGVLYVEGAPARGDIDVLLSVTEALRAAPSDSELALVVEVGERHAPETELDYRVAAAHERTLTVVRATAWQRWRWPFESMTDGTAASPVEMTLRLCLFAALCIGWLYAAGSDVASAVNGAIAGAAR
jgi:hypothetical protein